MVGVFRKDPELAIFLRKIDTYKEVFKKYTTFFIDSEQGFGGELYDTMKETQGAAPTKSKKK